MEERRKAKITNVREYRRFNNQLRRKTNRAKEVYIEEIWNDFQRKGRYALIYQKPQLSERSTKTTRTFGIVENQRSIFNVHSQTLRTWSKYIQDLYDSENHPKLITIEEEEEELNVDDRGPTRLTAKM